LTFKTTFDVYADFKFHILQSRTNLEAYINSDFHLSKSRTT
jgi:hypothetical protein